MTSPILITGASGVYEIVCQVTGKRYIGSSVDMNARKQEHLRHLSKGVHANPYLQKAFKKYGESKFEFRSLVICPPDELLIFEQQILDELKSYEKERGYNICRTAGSSKGRAAWNKGMTAKDDPRIKNYGKTQRGKNIPEKQRTQISDSLKGYKHTEQAKLNMSKRQKEKAWMSSERREKVRLLGKSEARLRILRNANKKRWASTESRRQARLRKRKRDNLGRFVKRDNCGVKD